MQKSAINDDSSRWMERLAFRDGYIESFNGKLCDECLNENIFVNLQEAKRLVETCREEYNENCPHNSLDGKTPNEMAREEEKLNGTSI